MCLQKIEQEKMCIRHLTLAIQSLVYNKNSGLCMPDCIFIVGTYYYDGSLMVQ